MEELDIAAERELMERESLVAAVRRRPGSGLVPCGACHFCGESTHMPKLFCDKACAEDHEFEQRRRN